MGKQIESVDASTKVTKKRGMGDPSEIDDQEDRANDLAAGRPVQARTLAEQEADRPREDPSFSRIDGTSAANVGRVRGGSNKCGNPSGYGTCGGDIDHEDPEGRCSKCGIPTRAAIALNRPDVHTDPEGVRDESEIGGARIGDLSGTIGLTMNAIEKESARLALARQITRAFWLQHGVDPENHPAFNRAPGDRLDPKIVRLMKECEAAVTDAYKRCGLLPRMVA